MTKAVTDVQRRRFEWTGIVAVIIALTLGIGWCAALISVATPPLDDTSKDLLGTIGGGMVAALGAFMGASIRARVEKDRDEEDKP